jgi:hypothetical protein
MQTQQCFCPQKQQKTTTTTTTKPKRPNSHGNPKKKRKKTLSMEVTECNCFYNSNTVIRHNRDQQDVLWLFSDTESSSTPKFFFCDVLYNRYQIWFVRVLDRSSVCLQTTTACSGWGVKKKETEKQKKKKKKFHEKVLFCGRVTPPHRRKGWPSWPPASLRNRFFFNDIYF